MIIDEYFMTRKDGVVLNKAYSDLHVYIEDNGVRYAEIVYPAHLEKHFIETDEPLPDDNESEEVVDEK